MLLVPATKKRLRGPVLPRRLRELLEPRTGKLPVGIPRTWTDVEFLAGFAGETSAIQAGFRLLRPSDGKKYFELLGVRAAEYSSDLAALQRRWPAVQVKAFRWPTTTDAGASRPPLLARGDVAPEAAFLQIPIYPDTTEAEVEAAWKIAMDLGRRLYPARAPRRERRDQYSRRLDVWDSYQRYRRFDAVARELGIAVRTARYVWVHAHFDIEGRAAPQSMKHRRVVGIDVETLAREYSTCQTCATTVRIEDACPKHRDAVTAYLAEGTTGGRFTFPA